MSVQPAVAHDIRMVATVSGARIVPIPEQRAVAFLARLDEVAPKAIDVALGAVEDSGTLIGVAVLSASAHLGAALVVVTPGRRRLKVGSDLLHALLEHAAARSLYYLTCCPRQDSVATDEFLRSFDLVANRQAHLGATTTLLLVVPDMTLTSHLAGVSSERPGGGA